MRVASLRELLLRKADGDIRLEKLIAKISDDLLVRGTIESLEKMARQAGKKANHAISSLGGYSTADQSGHSLEGEMFRDALGHHLSHYKSALGASNRPVADKHLQRAVEMMHVANRLHNNSGLRFQIGSGKDPHGKPNELVPPTAWEMRYTGDERSVKNPNEYQEQQKGWGRKLASDPNAAFPNYQFLEMAPHSTFKDKHKLLGYENHAYPFHEVNVNGRYVNIEDKPHTGEFVPHIFDSHPVHSHTHTKMDDFSSEHAKDYATKHAEWLNSPGVDQWMQQQAAKHEADPTHYEKAGLIPSAPIMESPAASDHIHSTFGRRNPESTRRKARGTAPIAKPVEPTEAMGMAAKIMHEHGHTPEQISSALNIPADKIAEILGKK